MTARADGRGRFGLLLVAVLVVGVGLSGVWAVASASKPDPRKAAKELVARTPHGKLCSFSRRPHIQHRTVMPTPGRRPRDAVSSPQKLYHLVMPKGHLAAAKGHSN